MRKARQHWEQTNQPENSHHRINLKRRLRNYLRWKFQYEGVRKEVEKNCKSASPKQRNNPFGEVSLPAFSRRLLPSSSLLPMLFSSLLTMFCRGARNLSVHLVHR